MPSSAAELTLSYAPIVQRVAPAVVNVYAAKVVENRSPFFEDPFFRRFFGGPNSGLPREQVQRSLGSGVIVDPRGLVVTNNHVIEGATEVRVALADKREFEAQLVLKDTRSDLSVLRLKDARETFPALELGNSDELQVGDVVLAIGDPFGVGQTVTHGIVSALARTQVGITDYQFFIQTDAAINPGNSGGALVDIHGRLIGINTAIYSRSGGSQGIGFAIPANMVRVVVTSARGGGTAQVGVLRGGRETRVSVALETAPDTRGEELVVRSRSPFLGARIANLSPALADELGIDGSTAGVAIVDISDGSVAANLGFKPGDLILSVNGQRISSTQDLERVIKNPKRLWRVTIERGGQQISVVLSG